MPSINRRRFLGAGAAGAAAGATLSATRATARASGGLTVTDLRAENTVELLGTDVTRPRLSWRLEGDERGIVQKSYRIRAASTREKLAAGEADLWDSEPVASAASIDIAYGGPPLRSMQRVWWTVEITDERGRRAAADPSWFEGGLLDEADWQADWIVAEDAQAQADRQAGLQWIWSQKAIDGRPHAFRLDFDAPGDLQSADLLVSGKDDLLGVWVNGEPMRMEGKTYWGTLTPFPANFRAGRNCVCVLVSAETEGFFPVDGGAMAALIRLHQRGGAVERLVSGSRWRVMPDPGKGWTAADFDASAWPHAQRSGSNAQNDPRPSEPALLLRTGFRPKRKVVGARLYATALGAYDARINGKRISRAKLAPEITVSRDHILYQTYDVTDLVREGENALGVVVGDGWYAGAYGWRLERYSFGPAPRRLRLQLRLDYDDGASDWVTTGPDWRIGPTPVLMSDIYAGETFDARLRTPGWDVPGFDEAQWPRVKSGEAPATRLVAQASPRLEPMRALKAVAVTQPHPGVHVLDFGQNFAGWARVSARGEAGATIAMKFAEILNDDGTVDQSNLRGARATDYFTLRGDAEGESFEPHFTYHGFRYIQIEGYPGDFSAEAVEAQVVHSACRETGLVRFDNPLLQKVWHNTLWSQRSNFFAVPTDCPQRDERMGWMGDIQVFADAAAFNMEVDPFLRRFLGEVRAAQRKDGGYPIVVPQPLSYPDVVTAGWSEAGIILPWTLWQRYGDTAVIDTNWRAMTAWMDFVARDNPDHIWRNDRGLDLGDWLSVDAKQPDDETTPRILCATAYWAYCAQLMADMAAASGRMDDARRYTVLRRAIGRAYAKQFVPPDGVAGNGSQTSQVLSLHFGLVPDALRARAAAVLADDIRRRGMKLSTGFLGTPYLLDALADTGRLEEVAGLLLQTGYPSWGYMPSGGATTIWERWNGDVGDVSMNSYNHYALGAVVGFHYRRLAGIAPGAPGFRRIAVRPLYLPTIGDVSAVYDSCMGRIETAVRGKDGAMTALDLTVPPNTAADVELPPGRWTESGRALAGHDDMRDYAAGRDTVRFTVGSGSYAFRA
ncbi:alpha-L-rhamnosidase [Stakelama saccharophila]|uniref:alpha-L-rhamnosidase n=1 Tax=Stakelama saccharophila TaxID=3075605 RepID=A0ABZ0BB51_9SPHN|nr:family 78 glycoside hydrolase catalytic domain [Stakelama sp. W311]WNO54083.1 family 78 glycoside hydrolase catalytic domain [Stakelama sp. W311]